jgi:plastocyanin domain-containing protein
MRLALVVAVALSFAGCKKAEESKSPPPPATAPTTTKADPGAPRKVAIEAGKEGYKPERIPGKPGEKLTLSFTRTVDADCLAKLKAPDGTMVDLPMNKPVDVAVTVPATGEVKFACGMDMFHGVVVAEN